MFGRSKSKDAGEERPKSFFQRMASGDTSDKNTTPEPKKRSSILSALSFSKDKDASQERRPSTVDVMSLGLSFRDITSARGGNNEVTADRIPQSMKDVYLKTAIKMIDNMKWTVVTLDLTTVDGVLYVLFLQGETELSRMMLDVTSFATETNIAPMSWAICSRGNVAHLQSPKDVVTLVWVDRIGNAAKQCDPFPSDPLFKEALLRQTGESYDVKFLEKRRLGVVFDRSQDWAHIKVSENANLGIEVGSVLSAINDESVTTYKYDRVQGMLRSWKPPFKLTFRRAPTMHGFLKRKLPSGQWERAYFELKEGKLLMKADAPSEPTAKLLLQGLTIKLTEGETHSFTLNACFGKGYGPDDIVMQAETHNECLDWASALYYGIAISNGGGYILALEVLAQQRGTSRKEIVAEAIARLTQQEMMKQMHLSVEEVAQIEEELREGVLADEDRQGIENDGGEDSDARIKEAVRGVIDDLLAVLVRICLTAEPVPDPVATKVESAVQVSAESLTPAAVKDTKPVETRTTATATANASSPASYAPLVVYRQKRVHLQQEEELDAGEAFPAVASDDIRRVFTVHAKTGADNKGYINVMQFSSIWRKATANKGNLFKEMQIFNSSFDLDGKGFVTEAEFVAGFERIGATKGGGKILNSLVKLTTNTARVR